MRQFASICGTLCIALLVGCGEADQCSDFPDKLDESIGRIFALPDAERDVPAVSAAKILIESCYPKASYAIPNYRIVQREAKKLDDNEYILTYEFDGISDIRIAFRVTAEGRVLSVFEISTL